HVALEFLHVMLFEHIAHQALTLAYEQLAVSHRRNAGGVLPAVLKHRERVVYALIDSAGSDDSGNATHSYGTSGRCGGKSLFDALEVFADDAAQGTGDPFRV